MELYGFGSALPIGQGKNNQFAPTSDLVLIRSINSARLSVTR
jgi:hypothetical protein